MPPSPTMPGNIAGSPPGPGASPVTAPGGGAGNSAAAISQVKAMMPALYKTLTAFPPGSKENRAVLSAIQALNPIFAESGGGGGGMVPAAIQQMAAAAKAGGPAASAPAPGLAQAPPSGDEPKIAA